VASRLGRMPAVRTVPTGTDGRPRVHAERCRWEPAARSGGATFHGRGCHPPPRRLSGHDPLQRTCPGSTATAILTFTSGGTAFRASDAISADGSPPE